MIESKQELKASMSVLLPVAHGNGGFAHFRAVPAKPSARTIPAIVVPSRQYGAQVPRAQQMQNGDSPACRQMGD